MLVDDYNCVLCTHDVEETLHHLLFDCPFAMACWNTLHLLVPGGATTFQILEAFKTQLRLPFFMEIVITMCWSIWTLRNDVVFRGMSALVQPARASSEQSLP